MREIDRESRIPAWQQIAADLEAGIRGGNYGVDGRLPSVIALTRIYGVNRKTAHKALRYLAGHGLIEVERGVGYYVRPRG